MTTWLWWILLLFGWLTALVWIDRGLRLFYYVWKRVPLDRLPEVPREDNPPGVCVIVPACNEEAAIERCLQSLLAQDYPRLHIIAVNDRSTDDTGAIMDRVAAASDRLEVCHITELPDGWLGKNHANHVGANTPTAKSSELMLFTDGDIFFDPDCIRRAVSHMKELDLDHLALVPHLLAFGFFEKILCHFFGVCFMLKCRIWAIQNPNVRGAFGGVGAFNLVGRALYERIGGHEPLRLEVLDDYKLGKLLKLAGGRSKLMDSGAKIRLRWQIGLGGVIKGFEKNGFAGCDYSLFKLVLTVGAMLIAFVAPPIVALLVSGAPRWGWGVAAIVQFVTLSYIGRSWAMALLSPFCGILMLWAIIRSAGLTCLRGGVNWRGTHYSLEDLKRGLV